MEQFVKYDSIVRKIWGKSDTILFIFAGAAAEFALNKSVDWLYFTGKLPSDPLGRLFSTVEYAKKIVFSEKEKALQAIDKIAAIHKAVENKRESAIPDWAYRDVLYMLIDYSIRAHEVLVNKLNAEEKEEVFQVFNNVGIRMGLKDLPTNYDEWLISRKDHMENNLEKSFYTSHLFEQYNKHLGNFRFQVLLEAQKTLVPAKVKQLLNFGSVNYLTPIIWTYKNIFHSSVPWKIRSLLLPKEYIDRIKALDIK